MKTITATLLLSISLFLGGLQVSQAQNMMSSASMMAMRKCSSGDSIVGVNMTTKMYMTQAQMKAKTAGMTREQKQAMMSKNT